MSQVWQTARCHVSKQYESANGRWLPLVSRCLLGLNCRILLQPEKKTQNRTSQSSDRSRRRPGSWRRSSSMRWCGQDWTTPAELCSVPSTGLLHLHFSLLSRRLESHGWTLSLSVFSCAGVCIYRFPFPCAPDDVAANLICLATIVQRVPWQGSSEGEDTCWNARQPMCAERLGHGCPQIFMSETWTSPTLNAVDGRRLEVVADGLSLWHGAQRTIDTTLVSPLRSNGTARRRAADHDGAALEVARRRKERTYPELAGERGRARLVVLAAEVGGRWSKETATFLAALAKARAESSPFILQGKVKASLIRRWSAMLACSAARACRSVFARPPSNQWQAPGGGGSSRLCTRTCGMHVLASLPVGLP